MNTELEFHDSDIRSMCFSGSDFVVDLSEAGVYPTADEQENVAGTYLQPVMLTFIEARVEGDVDATGWISDGTVTVDGVVFQLLPTPLSIEGTVFVSLLFTGGEQLKIEANGLCCVSPVFLHSPNMHRRTKRKRSNAIVAIIHTL